MDRGAWWAAVHGVAKSWTRLSDFTFNFHFHALEKEMSTHSSVLAWESQGWGSLVGCRLGGHTESDTTEMTTATTWHAESYFPNQGLNLSPLTWNLGALISGPPGKSPACIFNSPHSSDLCSITFPADLCVHGQRNNSMLSKEHTAGSSSLAGAHHLVNYRQVEVPAKKAFQLLLWCLMNQDILC